jgi:putative transposase
MSVFQSLAHLRWDCKYHVVFIPTGRKKALYGKIREYLKQVFHELARQRNCEIGEGYMAGDPMYMCIAIPTKYAVAEVVGYLKGKSAIAIARQFGGRQQNFSGEQFWTRGYAVSTVGFEVDKIRDYIRHQEHQEHEEDQGCF